MQKRTQYQASPLTQTLWESRMNGAVSPLTGKSGQRLVQATLLSKLGPTPCFAAAQEANICYVTSTYASCPLEDIVAAAPRGLRWYQLYVQSDWELNKQLIRRVEALGFKALVITVDVPVGAKRRQDIRNQLNLVANLMRMDLRSPEEVRKLSDPEGITSKQCLE